MERTLTMAAELRSHAAGDSLGPEDRAYCAVAEALLGENGLSSIVRDATEALEVLREPADPWATVALYLRGVACLYLGDMDAAAVDLEEGVELSKRCGVPDMRAHCLAALAAMRLASGDAEGAVPQIEQARGIVFANNLENIPATAPIFSVAASVMLASGRHEDAAHDAVRALRLTSLIEAIAPWHAVAGRLALANVYWQLGDHNRAAVLIDEARNRYGPEAQSAVFDVMLKEAEALVAGLEISPPGPSLLTTAELRVLQYLPSHLSFPEIGQRLYLSRHTVKSQALSSYRKLGVSSRSQAVERALLSSR
jgi:LuxR family maltose regulon positive regulatory protein